VTNRSSLHQFLLWGVYGSAVSEVGVAMSPRQGNRSRRSSPRDILQSPRSPRSPREEIIRGHNVNSVGKSRARSFFGNPESLDSDEDALSLRPKHVIDTKNEGFSPSRYSVQLERLLRQLQNPCRALYDNTIGS